MTIGALPDGALAHCLGFLDLRERCAPNLNGKRAVDPLEVTESAASPSVTDGRRRP